MLNKRLSLHSVFSSNRKEPIVCLTAYTTPMARIADPYVDMLLVGDSVGMVLYGMESTLSVDMEMMIRHTQAVRRGSSHALIVTDLPFASYQASPEQAFTSSARLISETGAAAVKLEGGEEMAETIRFLSQRGIPVVAHIGLMPQHAVKDGGYRIKGRNSASAKQLIKDAEAVEEAGAVAVVLEGVVMSVAENITKRLKISTIGIGASPLCDGQILVVDDMLGMFQSKPSFVKEYATFRESAIQAIEAYADDVRKQRFPNTSHCFAE